MDGSMLALLERVPATSNHTGDDDGLSHIFCWCDPDLSLCGVNLSGEIMVVDLDECPDLCVVCSDLEFVECPRCGT